MASGMRSRLAALLVCGSAGPAGAPSVLIAYGQSNVLALHQSKVPGYIVELQNRKAATAIDLFSTEAA